MLQGKTLITHNNYELPAADGAMGLSRNDAQVLVDFILEKLTLKISGKLSVSLGLLVQVLNELRHY